MRNHMNGGCVTVVQNIKIGDEVNNSQSEERLRIDDILNIKDLEDHEPDISISDSNIETADDNTVDSQSDKEIDKKVSIGKSFYLFISFLKYYLKIDW